jgi:ABC-type ATPase involved in cell division
MPAHTASLLTPTLASEAVSTPVHAPVAIQVLDVWKAFSPGIEVLQGASVQVTRGEIVVIEGPTGAGKTTLLRLLFGAERADAGTILVGGSELQGGSTPNLAALRRSMGLMVQGMLLLPALTVADNIGLALRAVKAPWRERRFRIYETLKVFGLEGRRDAVPAELSGGELQRVALARALVTRPALVLADEPTTLLDEDAARRVVAILRETRVRGATVLVATHDPGLAARLGARRVVLNAGRLHAAWPRGERA